MLSALGMMLNELAKVGLTATAVNNDECTALVITINGARALKVDGKTKFAKREPIQMSVSLSEQVG